MPSCDLAVSASSTRLFILRFPFMGALTFLATCDNTLSLMAKRVVWRKPLSMELIIDTIPTILATSPIECQMRRSLSVVSASLTAPCVYLEHFQRTTDIFHCIDISADADRLQRDSSWVEFSGIN